MVKQKESLRKELRMFMTWIRDQNSLDIEAINQKVKDIFAYGEFSKASADLLQMICGHRAETIQMRRDGIIKAVRDPLVKASLRNIPPSEINLFNCDQLVTTLEKAGGVKKAFWPVPKSSGNNNNASTSQVEKWPIRPSQGQYAIPQVPSQGRKYNSSNSQCMPSQGYGYQCWSAPSQGGHMQDFKCSSQGHPEGYDECIGHVYHSHSQRGTSNRGSYRTRGAKQNQRYQNPKRGSYTYKRKASPSGYNDKRSKYIH